MSLLDQRPAAVAPAAVPGAARRRRWRRARLASALVVLVLLLAAAWALPRTASLGSEATPTFGDRTLAVELAQFGEGGSYVLAYEDGAYGTVRLPVHNERAVPVTIRGVRLTDEPRSLAEVVAASARGQGMLPLPLGAGDRAVLELTVRFDNCDYYHERALEVLDRVLVDVAVLGVPGSVEVSLDRPILVRSPMIVDCPDRLLDRQAKTRRDG